MFRPGLSDRARYYCVVSLNQLALSHKDKFGGPALARKLIDLYFTLFKCAAACWGWGCAGAVLGSYWGWGWLLLLGWPGLARCCLSSGHPHTTPHPHLATPPPRPRRLIMEGKLGKGAQAAQAHEARVEAQKAAFKKARRRDAAKGGQQQGGKGKGKQPTRPPKPGKAPTAEELDARMLGALITGVRRAFPYVPSDEVEPLIEKHSGALFRWARAPAPAGAALLALPCWGCWRRTPACRPASAVLSRALPPDTRPASTATLPSSAAPAPPHAPAPHPPLTAP